MRLFLARHVYWRISAIRHPGCFSVDSFASDAMKLETNTSENSLDNYQRRGPEDGRQEFGQW